MKCPICNHVSDKVLLRCSACNTHFDREDLETYQHLEYLLRWLEGQAESLPQAIFSSLLQEVLDRQAQVRQQLRLEELLVPAAKPVEPGLQVSPISQTPAAEPGLPFGTGPAETPMPVVTSIPDKKADEIERTLVLIMAALEEIEILAEVEFLNRRLLQAMDRDLRGKVNALEVELAGRSFEPYEPAIPEVIDFLIDEVDRWTKLILVSPREEMVFRYHLLDRKAALRDSVRRPPAPAPVTPEPPPSKQVWPEKIYGQDVEIPVQPEPGRIEPRPGPLVMPLPRREVTKPALSIPRLPARPTLPTITWPMVKQKVINAAESGALLKGLLYLGAFMIVVSVTVLVIRFWDVLPTIIQLGYIAAVPGFFFLIGWISRARLELPLAGGVLTGIGALLVAVDFAAVYQFGGLSGSINPYLYWLVASIICTALYTATAWRLPTEFFGHITFLGATSTLVATGFLVGKTSFWGLTSAAIAAVFLLFLSSRLTLLSERWAQLAVAARHLPILLLPLTQVVILFVPGDLGWGQVVVFCIAAAGYGLLLTFFPSHQRRDVILLHVSVWSSVFGMALGLLAINPPLEWLASVFALGSLVYLLPGRLLSQRLVDDYPLRRSMLAAFYAAGFGLVAIAIISAVFTLPSFWIPGDIALFLATVVLIFCAPLFRQPRFMVAGSGLFILPFSIAVGRLILRAGSSQWIAWMTAAWVILALIYLVLALRFRRFERYVNTLAVWAQLLGLLVVPGLIVNFSDRSEVWFGGPTLVSLAILFLFYLTSAVLHDLDRNPLPSVLVSRLPSATRKSIFLWPTGFLMPVWLAVFWLDSSLPAIWLGPTLAAMGVSYVGLGQLLYRRDESYRLPPHAYAYLLPLVGTIVGAFGIWSLAAALLIAAIMLASQAIIYRRPLLLAAGSGLFILPFSLTVGRLLLDANISQWIAWLMAAWSFLALLYVIAGLALRKAISFGMTFTAWAQLLAPAALMGLVINYITGSQSWYSGPTLIALGGVLFFYAVLAVLHDRGRYEVISNLFNGLPAPLSSNIFLWPVGFLVPVWIAIGWIGGRLPLEWLGPVMAGLGLAYVIVGQILRRRHATYRLPPHAYAYLLPTAGILLALGHSWPLLTSLILSTVVLTSFAVVYRRLWDTAGAGLLFIWPFHLALSISPLTQHAYSLAYVLLAGLVYIPVGLALRQRSLSGFWLFAPDVGDESRYRLHANAYFVIGYTMTACAVGASLLGRFGLYLLDVPWIGIAVSLLATALTLFSLYRFHWRPFAWVTVLLAIVAYGQTLTFVSLPPIYDAAAWVILAMAFMESERLIHFRVRVDAWLVAIRWPLGSGSIALSLLGVGLTLPATLRAFSGAGLEEYGPLILAQVLATALTIMSARLYRDRRTLFIEPVLAFSATTLLVIGYGPRLFGQHLTTPQYSYLWIGLALAHLLVAIRLDHLSTRYAHGLYLGGYALIILANVFSTTDRLVNVIIMVSTIFVAVASQLLVHAGRHHTFDDFIRLLRRRPDSVAWTSSRTIFLFIAAYLFPVCLLQLLGLLNVTGAWRGTSFALVAPLYVALGLWLRRYQREYTWPLYSAGYALTAIGAMFAYGDQRLFIAVLCLDAVVYAVSAYIFQQAFWLYLSTFLAPIISLLILNYHEQLTNAWVAGIFMTMAFVYLAVGYGLSRIRAAGSRITPSSLPFYIPGYILCAVALAVCSSDKLLAIAIYSASVFFYAISALIFRESLFVYPATWLAVVPYYLIMTLTTLPTHWQGLGFLPLVTIYIAIGRFGFNMRSLDGKGLRQLLSQLTRPALPFYLIAYPLSLAMVILSITDAVALTLTLVSVALLYFVSAGLFRSPVWLYPGLLSIHLAVLAYFSIDPSGGPANLISLPFMVVTWLITMVGLTFEWRFPVERERRQSRVMVRFRGVEIAAGGWPFLQVLRKPAWSQPFFLFAALDIFLWLGVAMFGFQTATIVATGFAILLALLATLWSDGGLVYGSLLLTILGSGAGLMWAGLTLIQTLAALGGVSVILYAVARILEWALPESGVSSLWSWSLTRTAICLSVIAVVGTLPSVASQTPATASALASAGALYLAIAYRGRYFSLGYLAAAMVQIAWVLVLLFQSVKQPQLYAIPVGIYFTVIGLLERRREREHFANYLEGFGLAILLLTSFIQSLDPNGGFPYFLLMLLEALLTIAWGALRRIKVPFFTGIFATVLNIVAQLVLVAVVNDVMRWVVTLGGGCLVFILGLLAERLRATGQIREWRSSLEDWS